MKTWQCIVCGFIYDEAKAYLKMVSPLAQLGWMCQITGNVPTVAYLNLILKWFKSVKHFYWWRHIRELYFESDSCSNLRRHHYHW